MSPRVTKSPKASRASRLIQVEHSNASSALRLIQVEHSKVSRTLRLIQVEHSNALIDLSILNQAFFKRYLLRDF